MAFILTDNVDKLVEDIDQVSILALSMGNSHRPGNGRPRAGQFIKFDGGHGYSVFQWPRSYSLWVKIWRIYVLPRL